MKCWSFELPTPTYFAAQVRKTVGDIAKGLLSHRTNKMHISRAFLCWIFFYQQHIHSRKMIRITTRKIFLTVLNNNWYKYSLLKFLRQNLFWYKILCMFSNGYLDSLSAMNYTEFWYTEFWFLDVSYNPTSLYGKFRFLSFWSSKISQILHVS